MRLSIIIAVAVGILGYVLTLYFDHAPAPKVRDVPPVAPAGVAAVTAGEEIPAFSFTDIDGRTHDIRAFKGKVVILNFWASWCAPCVKEFPALLDAARARRDDAVLVALSSDHDREAMIRFLGRLRAAQDMPANVYIALDENQAVTRMFGTFSLPETILVDRGQKIGHKFVGATWTPEELDMQLDRLP